ARQRVVGVEVVAEQVPQAILGRDADAGGRTAGALRHHERRGARVVALSATADLAAGGADAVPGPDDAVPLRVGGDDRRARGRDGVLELIPALRAGHRRGVAEAVVVDVLGG